MIRSRTDNWHIGNLSPPRLFFSLSLPGIYFWWPGGKRNSNFELQIEFELRSELRVSLCLAIHYLAAQLLHSIYRVQNNVFQKLELQLRAQLSSYAARVYAQLGKLGN